MPILFWGALFVLIASAFVRVASTVVTVVKIIVPIIVRVFVSLGKVVVRVGQAFADFARTIAHAAKAFVDQVVKPVISAIQKFFEKLENFFARVTQPIRDIIERVNKALDWIWTKVVSPVLEAIERVRAILRLLAELGVGWAEKLDKILQTIETKIYETFREVRSWVNTFELWLDLLLDPGGWIKSFPFLYTVVKWQGNIMGILVNLGLDPLAFDKNQLAREEHPNRKIPETVERFRSRYYQQHFGVQRAIAQLKTRGTFGS